MDVSVKIVNSYRFTLGDSRKIIQIGSWTLDQEIAIGKLQEKLKRLNARLKQLNKQKLSIFRAASLGNVKRSLDSAGTKFKGKSQLLNKVNMAYNLYMSRQGAKKH